MNKDLIKYIIVASFTVLIFSCAKDERLMYAESPAVYFFKAGQVNSDSTDFSFASYPDSVKTDTVFLWMKIVGQAADYDREINLVPMAGATAKEGYHYTFLSTVMPANAYETQLPVLVHRRPGLKDSVVSALFEIQQSADFKPGFPDNYSFNAKLDRLHYKIRISDILGKPGNWETVWAQYFGVYSLVKYQFLIQATGRTNWASFPFPQDSRFMVQQAKLALLEYQQTKGPLRDENGQEIFFP